MTLNYHNVDIAILGKLLWLSYLVPSSLGASDYFSVKLDNVSRLNTNLYSGDAGKSHFVVYTGECPHEVPKDGEWASFSWYGSDGMIGFGSNADMCKVTKYLRSQ